MTPPARAGGLRVGKKIGHKKDPRHRAREIAVQVLYQWEIGRSTIDQAVDTFFTLQWPDEGPPPDAIRSFATGLARDTVAELERIDALIADTSARWRPERMPVLDRLIIRLAVCELLRGPQREVPPAVVINEALELARTFSTEESVKFINGMLDAIRKKLDTR